MSSATQVDSLLDRREFRRALGNFATGVTVVTARALDGTPVGVTASSFNSVSLDPPLILWSLDKRARSRPVYEAATHFAVNVLSAAQVELSERFAKPLDNKFHGVEWRDGIGGAPLLSHCAATFQCQKTFVYEGGDHLILVGEVVDFTESGHAGLLFYRGEYSVSEPHPQRRRAEGHTLSGFVGDYIEYLLAQAATKIQRGFAAILTREKIAEFEWRILATLGDHDQGLSGGELSIIVLMPSAEIDTLLSGLITRGWVGATRAPDGSNLYRLTLEGQAKLVPMQAAASAHEADALGAFTASETRLLKDLLKRLAGGRNLP